MSTLVGEPLHSSYDRPVERVEDATGGVPFRSCMAKDVEPAA